jgi:hypothetical protein
MHHRVVDIKTGSMTLVIVLLNLSILVTLIWIIWTGQQTLRSVYWPSLIFKVLCGVSLGLLYRYYYTTGDTFSFFQDATVLSDMARKNNGEYLNFLWNGDESFSVWSRLNYSQTRSVFFTKLISVVNLLTYDNYWITSLYFSLISFCGSLYLSRKLVMFFPDSFPPVAIAFLFFPSVVFWSSGVLKEAIALPGIFFLSGIFLTAWHRHQIKWYEWILLPIAFLWVWKLKYFYLAVFLPITFATLVTKFLVLDFFRVTKLGFQVLAFLALIAGSTFMITFFHPNFHLNYLPEVIVMNNQDYTRASNGENLVHFQNLEPDFFSIAKHSPKALLAGIFRPGIWEADTTLKLLAAIETLGLVLLVILNLANWRKITLGPYRLLTLAVLMYVVLLCVFLTISTPNLGTLVRYRIGFMPFLVFVLLNTKPLRKNLERLFSSLVREK